MSERRSIGPVDTMWLNMDRPSNLMVIDSVMWFDETIDIDRLAEVVEHRLVGRYPVFSQRPVPPSNPFGMPYWEDDPDFDLRRHLRTGTLAAPGDQDALQRYVENRMSVPFDRDHPLWEMTLLHGFGTGCAVVCRFHHSLADGIALAEVLLSLTDASPSADSEDVEPARPTSRHTGGSGIASALQDIGEQVLRSGEEALRTGLRAVSMATDLATSRVAFDALELGWKAGKVADKLLLGSNPKTLFSGEPGIEKRAVWSGPRTIAEVKKVGRITGATVNDVLVAVVSGAINIYQRDRGADPVDLTTMVPVNVRPRDLMLPRELGNQFALVYLLLPTGVTPALQRVAESKHRMDSIKASPEAQMTFGLNKLIGRSEPHLEKLIVNFFSNKAIGVTTNVIGPGEPRYVAGAPIAGVVSWVPGSGKQSLGVCIFSFAGTVRVGFKADAATLPDVEKLVHAFDEDMDQLLWIANNAR